MLFLQQEVDIMSIKEEVVDCDGLSLKGKSYTCYFDVTLDIIGGKWKPIILYHLGDKEVMRYSDFKRAIPKITERMLTKQLRELEEDQIVSRKVYNEIPPKVEYRLTAKGTPLIHILNQLKDFGEIYYTEVKR